MFISFFHSFIADNSFVWMNSGNNFEYEYNVGATNFQNPTPNPTPNPDPGSGFGNFALANVPDDTGRPHPQGFKYHHNTFPKNVFNQGQDNIDIQALNDSGVQGFNYLTPNPNLGLNNPEYNPNVPTTQTNTPFYSESNFPVSLRNRLNQQDYPIAGNSKSLFQYWDERYSGHKEFFDTYLKNAHEKHQVESTSNLLGQKNIDYLRTNEQLNMADRIIKEASHRDIQNLANWIENTKNQFTANGGDPRGIWAKNIGLSPIHNNNNAPDYITTLFSNYIKQHPKYFGCNNYGNIVIDDRFIAELKHFSTFK